MIAIKIDVTKIDKALLFKGQKGTYLNVTLKDNRDGTDQYGNDGFVTQDVSKEAREAGTKGPIIGNWRNVGSSSRPQGEHSRNPAPPAKRPPSDPDLDAPEENLPF